ncbi:hypothetical protein LIER_15117 [Lithospermum erythrorhizon]|uniref:Uncharacterized protein n=1 Tax=Lithospermum erythrorhizon TaxID=34254 RepID=A0AAV3Q349_LITER
MIRAFSKKPLKPFPSFTHQLIFILFKAQNFILQLGGFAPTWSYSRHSEHSTTLSPFQIERSDLHEIDQVLIGILMPQIAKLYMIFHMLDQSRVQLKVVCMNKRWHEHMSSQSLNTRCRIITQSHLRNRNISSFMTHLNDILVIISHGV